MSTAAAVLGQAEDALIAGTAAAFAVESMMPSYGFSCRAVVCTLTRKASLGFQPVVLRSEMTEM